MKRAIAVGGDAELLSVGFCIGGVGQRSVDRIHRRGQADGAAGDRAGQGRRVTQDEDFTIREGRDRGEAQVAHVVLQVQVGEQELVLEFFLELGELFRSAQLDAGAGGGELVAQDVEDIDAVEAVDVDLLILQARRDSQRVIGFEGQRGAEATTGAVVHVAFDAAVRLDGVDEARELGGERGDAQRGLFADRNVDGTLEVAADVAALNLVQRGFNCALIDADLRRIGDIADGARQRARAEQRALGAAQHFDAVQVEQVEVRGEQRHGDDAFVQIDADLLLHARLIADDLAGGDAADGDLALPGAEVLDGKAGDGARQVLDVGNAAVADGLFALRADGEGHIDQGFFAFACGDDQFFNFAFGGKGSGGSREGHGERQRTRLSHQQGLVDFHEVFSLSGRDS